MQQGRLGERVEFEPTGQLPVTANGPVGPNFLSAKQKNTDLWEENYRSYPKSYGDFPPSPEGGLNPTVEHSKMTCACSINIEQGGGVAFENFWENGQSGFSPPLAPYLAP